METAEFIGQCLIMFSTRFGLDPGAQRVMVNFGEGAWARKPGNVGLPKIESMVRGTIPFIMKVMNQGLEGPRPTLQRGTSKRKSDMYAGLPLCDEPQSLRLIGSPAYAMFQAVDGASHFSPEFCPMSKYGHVLTLRCGHSCCDDCDRTVAKLRCVRCSVLFLSLTAVVALIHRNRAHNKVILLEDLKASVHYTKKNAISAWLLQTAMRTVLKHSKGGECGEGVGEGENSEDDSDDFGVHADHDTVLAATLQDGELISEVDAWFRSTSATTTMPPSDANTSDFAVDGEGIMGDEGIFEELGGGGKASGGGKQHIVPTATDADINAWVSLSFTPSTHPAAERVLLEQAAQELERKRRIAANPAAAAAAKQDAKKVAAKKRGRTAEQAAKVDDAKRRKSNGLPAKKQGACASGGSTAAAAKQKSKIQEEEATHSLKTQEKVMVIFTYMH
jgi:hypothetical protein